jgi:hypothetical protein
MVLFESKEKNRAGGCSTVYPARTIGPAFSVEWDSLTCFSLNHLWGRISIHNVNSRRLKCFAAASRETGDSQSAR